MPYGRQTVGFGEAFSAARVVLSPNLTQGPMIEELERSFCDYTGAKYAVAVNSGTAALHIAALAAEVATRGTTYVPSLTFAASATSVLNAGGKVRLVDVSRATWNIDFEKIPASAKCVVTVDFAGLPSELPTRRHYFRDTLFIEDSAHSLGAKTPGGPTGGCKHSDMTCFSLHPVKTITSGEGGVVTTNSVELANVLRRLRSHGINREAGEPWEYDIANAGFNYRMTDIQAAIALKQMKRIDRFVAERHEIAGTYRELLKGFPVTLSPLPQPGYSSAHHLFPILLASQEQRKLVYSHLKTKGITTQVHYRPLQELSLSRFLDHDPQHLSVSSSIGRTILSLPIYPRLSKKIQRRVVAGISEALEK